MNKPSGKPNGTVKLIATLIGLVLACGAWVGTMQAQVKRNTEDVKGMKTDIGQIAEDVAFIRGKMEANP